MTSEPVTRAQRPVAREKLYVAYRQGGQLENIETSQVRVFTDLNVARRYTETIRGSWIIYHANLDSGVDELAQLDSSRATGHGARITP